MIDELLGRASLKERIDELETENERLRRRYEAESERRAEAATAKQEAERQHNRLEDRLAQLEGELERLRDERAGSDRNSSAEPRRNDRLRGSRLLEVLDRLESVRTAPEGALTAVIDDPSDVPEDATEILGDRRTLLADATPCVFCADDAGLISVALSPPVHGDPQVQWSDRFTLERDWFLPRGRFAFALVRADLFALGVYEDDERVAYRGFESDVKGSHSKGGFSQGRFERIRDGQIADHLERSREAIAEYEGDRLYLVGQREAISRLSERAGVEPVATATVDATGAPKSALDDAFRDFFTTTVHVI